MMEKMEAEAEAMEKEAIIVGANAGAAPSSPVPVRGNPAPTMAAVEQPPLQVAESKLITGFNARDEEFMNEQRKFMADIKIFMQTHQEMQQKIDISMRSKVQEAFDS